MKKSDLRTGMVVESRDGSVGVVLLNTATVSGIKWFLDCDRDRIDFWQELNEYDNNLMLICSDGDDEEDIMKIYQPSDFNDYTTMKVYCDENLIFDREIKNISGEYKDVTMKDIEEKFGCKVKIVG